MDNAQPMLDSLIIDYFLCVSANFSHFPTFLNNFWPGWDQIQYSSDRKGGVSVQFDCYDSWASEKNVRPANHHRTKADESTKEKETKG